MNDTMTEFSGLVGDAYRKLLLSDKNIANE